MRYHTDVLPVVTLYRMLYRVTTDKVGGRGYIRKVSTAGRAVRRERKWRENVYSSQEWIGIRK